MPTLIHKSTFSREDAMHAAGIFFGTPALSLLCFILGRSTILAFDNNQTMISKDLTAKDLLAIGLSPLFLTIIYLASKDGGVLPTLFEKAKSHPHPITIGKLAAAVFFLTFPTYAVLATLTNLDLLTENGWKSFMTRNAINYGLNCLGIVEASFLFFLLMATHRSYERYPTKKEKDNEQMKLTNSNSDIQNGGTSPQTPTTVIRITTDRTDPPTLMHSRSTSEVSESRNGPYRRTRPGAQHIRVGSSQLFAESIQPPPPPGTPPENTFSLTVSSVVVSSNLT